MGDVGAPDGVELGRRVGPFDARLDGDFLRRWAAATGDPSPRAQAGSVVPALALVTRSWEAQEASRSAGIVSEAVGRAAASGVHGEHDVLLHRPLVPGEPLRTWVSGHGSRPAGAHAAVTVRYTTVDDADAVVAEQWWTTIYLGTTCATVGEAPPDHRFPDAARERPLGTWEVGVGSDLARTYAEVSGDWSPHHFELEAARRSGADRPFLHGLCTMALCAQGVVSMVAGGDHERVRRVAVRFASPAPIGSMLRVELLDTGAGSVAFEASCDGAPAVTHGLVELRP